MADQVVVPWSDADAGAAPTPSAPASPPAAPSAPPASPPPAAETSPPAAPTGTIAKLFGPSGESPAEPPPAVPPPPVAPPEPDLPEKFRGKSAAEIARSAEEAARAMHAATQERADLKRQNEQLLAAFQTQQAQAAALAQQQAQGASASSYLQQLADLQLTNPVAYQTEMVKLQADLVAAKTNELVRPLYQQLAQSQALLTQENLIRAIQDHPTYAAVKETLSRDVIIQHPLIQRELADVAQGRQAAAQVDLVNLAASVLGAELLKNPAALAGQFAQHATQQAEAQAQARSLSLPTGASRTVSASARSPLSQQQHQLCQAMGISAEDFLTYGKLT